MQHSRPVRAPKITRKRGTKPAPPGNAGWDTAKRPGTHRVSHLRLCMDEQKPVPNPGTAGRRGDISLGLPVGWAWKDDFKPKPDPQEFPDDVVEVARSRPNGTMLEQIAKDFGIYPMTLSGSPAWPEHSL